MYIYAGTHSPSLLLLSYRAWRSKTLPFLRRFCRDEPSTSDDPHMREIFFFKRNMKKNKNLLSRL